MSKNTKTSAKEKIKNLDPSILESAGIIKRAKRGYICPFCGNGSGKDGTGLKPKQLADGFSYYCFRCEKKYDNLDLIGAFLNLDAKNRNDFKRILEYGKENFGVGGGSRAEKNFVKQTSPGTAASPSPEQSAISVDELNLIKSDIADGQKQLPAFVENCGGKFRGLTLATLEKFGCGYLPKWNHTKNRIAGKNITPSRRLIIPTSERHYLAVAIDRQNVDKTFWKQHAGKKEIFNFDGLKAANSDDLIFVVEGEIDALSTMQATGLQAVAVGGAASGEILINALSNITERKFIVLFDDDEGGRTNAPKLTAALIEKGFPAVEKYLPSDESLEKVDANAILRKYGDAKLSEILSGIVEESTGEFENISARIDENRNRQEIIKNLFSGYLGDLDNAGRILKVHGDEIRFLEDTEKWLIYKADKWEESKTAAAVVPFAKHVAEIIENYANPDDKTQKALLNVWRRKNTVANAIYMLQGFNEIRITEQDLNNHPELLNCQNGVVDLQTGKLYRHNPELLFTQKVNAAYRADVRNETVDHFFESILPDAETRAALLRYLGYCLTGNTNAEKALFIIGDGGNGKGTLSRLLMNMLADYCTSFPIESVLTSYAMKDGDAATPAFAKLQYKRLAIAEEIPAGRRLDYAKFKILTGGDVLPVRKLHQNATEIKNPSHKLIFSGNHLPTLDDTNDNGILRRWLQIPFEQTFTGANCDESLKIKLQSPDALTGLLSLLVANAAEWYKSGLIISGKMEMSRQEYFDENNFVDDFINQFCERGNSYHISRKAILDKIRDEYSQAVKMKDSEIISALRRVEGISYRKGGSNKTYQFYGIRFNENVQTEFESEIIPDEVIPF